MICLTALIATPLTPAITSAASNSSSSDFIFDSHVQELAKNYNSTPQVIDKDTIFIPLSKEENIKYLSKSQNISLASAERVLETSTYINKQDRGISINASDSFGEYVDLTGIVLKRFAVVSGLSRNCTVVAAINVLVGVYWEYANQRKFLAVYDSGVSFDESGFFTWNQTTKSAVIMSNGDLNFNASGSISGQISVSLSGGYERAGFSVSGSVGSNINVNKFQTIRFTFDPNYPGWILN